MDAPPSRVRNATRPPQTPVRFRWRGIDRLGSRVRGECLDLNEAAARRRLLQEGINVVALRRAEPAWQSLAPGLGLGHRATPGSAEQTLFLRKLATLFASGIPLLRAFELLAAQGEAPASNRLARELGQRLQEGATLAGALASRPDCFDRVARELIAAGERSGTLEGMLERVAEHHAARERLRARLKKALFYPSIVVAFGLLVALGLLLWVVPRFEAIFIGLGSELPALTRGVFDASGWLRENGHWAAGGLLGLLVLRVLPLPPGLRDAGLAALYRIPWTGTVLRLGGQAQICRTLGTLYGAGIPLVEALEQTAGTVFDARAGRSLMAAALEMRGGSNLSRALRATGRFPDTLLGMLQIGEESGRLGIMLERAAQLFESDLDRILDRLLSLIEPVTMAVLGLLVGGLMLAMYLPVFLLGQTL